jgi:hypothetical protein
MARRRSRKKQAIDSFLTDVNSILTEEIASGKHDLDLMQRMPPEMPAGTDKKGLPSYALSAINMLAQHSGFGRVVEMVLVAKAYQLRSGVRTVLNWTNYEPVSCETPEMSFSWRCVFAMSAVIYNAYLIDRELEILYGRPLSASGVKARKLSESFLNSKCPSAPYMQIPLPTRLIWNDISQRAVFMQALDISLEYMNEKSFNFAAWSVHRIRDDEKSEPSWLLVKSVVVYVPSQCAVCFETVPGYECSTANCAYLTCAKCISATCVFCTIGKFNV